jgi:hypothetical protein
MKPKSQKMLPVLLAGILQMMPFLRSALPALEFAGSPAGSVVMRWVAGGVAFFGYHAISSASSISISPPTATIGHAYSGTLTYSGSHSGSVSSMKYNGVCLGSTTFAPGMTITYNGSYTASITGTPTGTVTTTSNINMFIYDGICSGLSDNRSTSFTIQTNPVVTFAPTITVAPQSLVSQVGADALFSGGATGNPNPVYYWKLGPFVIGGGTTNANSLLIPAVQLTNSGVYTLLASNSVGSTPAACYLSVALTPGSNILAYQFTNYALAGLPLTMTSYITNVSTDTNTYQWGFNHSTTGFPATSNLNLTASQTTPSHSGIYSIFFNSTVGSTVIVNNQSYDSYWSFGYLPGVTNQPTGGTVPDGTNFTFNATVTGTTPTVLWYQNGTNLISSQTLSAMTNNSATASSNVSLTLSNVTTGNSGTYTLQVTNFWGATVSSNAVLTVQSGSPPPAPVLQGSVSAGQLLITFPAVVSQSYTVEYKTNLNDPTWSQLTNFTAGSPNATASDAISNSPQRYYRVSAP